MTDHAVAIEAPRSPSGLLAWVTTVDHKKVGIMYLLGAVVFSITGGCEALMMRAQLAVANETLTSPGTYNQLFTMHGTTMIFFVATPLVIGLATYVVPLMIGARDMAFPRLNALGFWMFLGGGLLLHYGALAHGIPEAGWFSYAPLSEHPYTMSRGTDYFAISLLVSGVGTVSAALNLLVTVLTCRTEGMTWGRMPLFVWMVVVDSVLILLAIPVLNAALVMLVVDRMLGGMTFVTDRGGSALLWQHLFWVFGHPEVYILILPFFGAISEVIPVFSRKPIFGYAFVALSTALIAFLSFGVWIHHMFAVGLGSGVNLLFAIGSMAIAVPTGVKIFNWIATMFGGSLRMRMPMLFAIAFIIEFTIGGLSGVTLAVVPFDWQVTDTYYIVAHFHYVLIGGVIFSGFAALYYWLPKITGRMLSERLGRWHFWTTIVGFNLTFFVQHFLGFMGMPRRVYTYPDLPGWTALNAISSVGAFILGISFLLFFVNLWVSLRRGEPTGDNPWGGWTLEWATSSPPPEESFRETPVVRSRRPLLEPHVRERLGEREEER